MGPTGENQNTNPPATAGVSAASTSGTAISDPQAEGLLAAAVKEDEAAAANQSSAGNVAVGEHGFPENTPLAAMNFQQQAAYWKHYARRHEDRLKAQGDYESLKAKARELDALLEASKTEQEKAIDEARRRGREEALAEVGGKLVEAHVRAAAAGRAGEDQLTALLEGLDRSRFLDSGGNVDTDKVATYVNTVLPPPPPAATPAAPAPSVPAPAMNPDMGQGRREAAPLSGLEAGRAAARARIAQRQSVSKQPEQ